MSKLKSCPFCGAEAELTKIKVSYEDYCGMVIRPTCSMCGAVSPRNRGWKYGSFKDGDEEMAIEAWNRRAEDHG